MKSRFYPVLSFVATSLFALPAFATAIMYVNDTRSATTRSETLVAVPRANAPVYRASGVAPYVQPAALPLTYNPTLDTNGSALRSDAAAHLRSDREMLNRGLNQTRPATNMRQAPQLTAGNRLDQRFNTITRTGATATGSTLPTATNPGGSPDLDTRFDAMGR
jgi:hypothetical protein